MNSNKNIEFSAIYGQIARENGTSPAKVMKEMQIALDAAWDNPDVAVRRKQRELFPDGKPTLEEFICKVSELAKTR